MGADDSTHRSGPTTDLMRLTRRVKMRRMRTAASIRVLRLGTITTPVPIHSRAPIMALHRLHVNERSGIRRERGNGRHYGSVRPLFCPGMASSAITVAAMGTSFRRVSAVRSVHTTGLHTRPAGRV